MANSRNYRVPTQDDKADVPYWNDLLAADVANDVDALEGAVEDVQAISPRPSVDESYLRGWVDASRRLALGIKPDGSVDAPVLESGMFNGIRQEIKSAEVTGYLRAFTDASGRVVFGIRTDGYVDIPLLNTVSGVTAEAPTTYRRDEASLPVPITAGPGITVNGDSLTAAGWGNTLAAATGRTVTTNAVGGENSAGIAARQGGAPYLMLPAGGSIPASGPVAVTFTTMSGKESWPILQGGPLPGTWNGIAGTLSITKAGTPQVHDPADVYTFTRTTAGTAVPLTRPAPFRTTLGEQRRADIQVFWAGNNNTAETDQIAGDVAAMIEHLSTLERRYLVLSVTTRGSQPSGSTGHTNVTTHNLRMLRTYGRRYLDIRRYLIDYGLADAGITPTTQDTADVAADTVPASLRVDDIHLTAAGYGIVAAQVQKRLTEMGWI